MEEVKILKEMRKQKRIEGMQKMEKIISIFDNCLKKLKTLTNRNNLIDDDEIKITHYSIYLTSCGFRNGTYLELYFINDIKNEVEYVKTLMNAFKDLRNVENIDIYVGKIYDSSNFRDTLYIYYKPREIKLFKIIKKIEAIDRYNEEQMYKIQNHIAKLLSYDVVNYKHTEEFITIDFRIIKTNLNIMSYYTTKKNLVKTYDKLLELNKILYYHFDYQFCELVVSGSGY